MFKHIYHFCKITIATSPLFFCINIMLLFSVALFRVGTQYAFKLLTDSILYVTTHPADAYWIILSLCCLMLSIWWGGNRRNFEALLGTKLLYKGQKLFHTYFLHKSYTTPQDYFYQPEFYNDYTFTKSHISHTSDITLTLFVKLTLALFSLILSITAIVWIHPLAVCLMVGNALLLFGINSWTLKKRIILEENATPDLRHATYYQKLLTSRASSKEIRLFHLQDFFMEKWHHSYRQGTTSLYHFKKLAICLNHLPQLLEQLTLYGLTLYFLYLVTTQKITLGDFVFLEGIMVTLSSTIQQLIQILSKDLPEHLTYIKKYNTFIGDVTVQHPTISPTSPISPTPFESLVVEDVCYTYPTSSQPALSHINFSIKKGEVVSILGYNGSGKSTFSKVISGVLTDYTGSISLNSTDIRTFDQDTYSKYFGMAFQEYTPYSLSVKENIGVGSVEHKDNLSLLYDAIEQSHLDTLIKTLPHGLETLLGKEYDEQGTDLSGGQWQRIILARAYMGTPDILILDEPTASIDPLQEMEMLNHFKSLISGQTAILISHRIGFARLADRICIMEDGQLIEEGTHDTLLAQHGRYYELFMSQYKLYQEEAHEHVN